ncbi:hypothetical protein Tco_0751217 [Tanacetum coccineum]|uniref:Uncharacterized protein n=1 Tax=Tanacetum coccineum TaxID=301880 RepID=A0ABQ4Z612_9ASTR
MVMIEAAGFKPCKMGNSTNCDRFEVWELVPRPIYVMVIALKWIYKVKLDEYGDSVLKNKAGTINIGFFGIRKNNVMSLTAYADAGYAEMSRFKKKFVGKCTVHDDRLVSWSSKKQTKHGAISTKRLNRHRTCLDVVLKSFRMRHSSKELYGFTFIKFLCSGVIQKSLLLFAS